MSEQSFTPHPEATPPLPHEEELAQELCGADDVAPYEAFEALLKKHGFDHWKRGTYRTGGVKGTEGRECTYLYMKPGAYFDDEPAARKFLEKARTLTARGVLLPDTRWRLVRHPSGAYAAVAVMRELSQPDVSEAEETWSKRPKFKIEWLYERAGVDSANMDAAFDDPESFIHYLEPGETQHSNNWGWSSERKLHYPIDVEVVMANADPGQKASNDAAVQRARAWQSARASRAIEEF